MQVKEAIFNIRLKTNDREELGLEDDELLSYLNESIQQISSYLVGSNSLEMLHEVTIEEPQYTLPDNFVRFAGKFPIKVTGRTAELLDDPPVKIRYFQTNGTVCIKDPMPFHHDILNQLAVKLACVFVQMQQHFDVTQDKVAVTEIMQSVASAVNGVE